MAVMIVTTAIANPERRDHSFNNHDMRHRPHPQAIWRGNDGWILPAIFLGSILAIEANRPQPVVVQQPVIVQPVQQPTYKYVQAYDPSCSCYKQVLIPINE